MANNIIIVDDHAEIILLDRYNNDVGHALIDIEDIDRCKKYVWRAMHTNNALPYGIATLDGKQVLLHRFITGYSGELFVDHINRNPLDNRKNNLRIATPSINQQNTDRCMHEYAGIEKRRYGWAVSIKRNTKRYYVGTYRTREDALAAKNKFLKEMVSKNVC